MTSDGRTELQFARCIPGWFHQWVQHYSNYRTLESITFQKELNSFNIISMYIYLRVMWFHNNYVTRFVPLFHAYHNIIVILLVLGDSYWSSMPSYPWCVVDILATQSQFIREFNIIIWNFTWSCCRYTSGCYYTAHVHMYLVYKLVSTCTYLQCTCSKWFTTDCLNWHTADMG